MATETAPGHLQDILVARSKTKEYCRRHGLLVTTLDNGIVIAGANRPATDRFDANLTLHFGTGSYFDPIPGMAHLIEHLISNTPDVVCKESNARYNAYTSPERVLIEISGVAHPAERDYGLWPAIPAVFASLTDPLGGFPDPPLTLEREKRVISGEIAETQPRRLASFDHFVDTIVLPPGHPDLTNTLGSDADLAAITPADIRQHAAHLFAPQGLRIRICSQGDQEMMTILGSEVAQLFSQFPGEELSPLTVPANVRNSINSDYGNGNVYAGSSGNPHNPYTVNFAWLSSVPKYARDNITLSHFIPLVKSRLFSFHRANGLGYSSDAYVQRVTDQHLLTIFNLTVPKQLSEEQAKRLYKALRESVLAGLSVSDFENEVAREQKRQRAVPLTIEERLNLAIDGIIDYGLIIDGEGYKDSHNHLTAKDLAKQQEKYLSEEPSIIFYK